MSLQLLILAFLYCLGILLIIGNSNKLYFICIVHFFLVLKAFSSQSNMHTFQIKAGKLAIRIDAK